MCKFLGLNKLKNLRVFEYNSNASQSEETRIAAIKACDAQNQNSPCIIIVRNDNGSSETLFGSSLGVNYSRYILISYYCDPIIYTHCEDSITSKTIA